MTAASDASLGVRTSYSRRPSRRALVALGLLSTALLVANPAGANGTRALGHSQAARFSVGVARCTFVDRTRDVLNYSTSPPSILSSSRTLVTEVRYPTAYVAGGPSQINGAPPVARAGGYPMIVFAHGYDVTPDVFAALLDAWVRAGFVVAAPLFPDENQYAVAAQHGANTEDDILNEPADMAFVTRSLLQASLSRSTGCQVVSGLIQPTELALAGHSDGATAVGLFTYARGNDPQGVSYASLRAGLDFRAVAILSGEEDSAQAYAPPASDPALLVIQSAKDQCNPIRNSVKLYVDIHQPNKWFLELLTAHHLPPFDGVDVPAFRVVAATTTRFFRVALQGANPTVSFVVFGNEHPTVAQMFSAGSAPTLSSTNLPEDCGRT
ncbi:MAG: alpha/beta hydrolase [Acidimicrobiales bacterium]